MCSNVISLFWRGKQWDRAYLPEKDFSSEFFICLYTFLALYAQFFIQVGFVLKHLTLLGGMKLLVNPQWTQFFSVVPCPTR